MLLQDHLGEADQWFRIRGRFSREDADPHLSHWLLAVEQDFLLIVIGAQSSAIAFTIVECDTQPRRQRLLVAVRIALIQTWCDLEKADPGRGVERQHYHPGAFWSRTV